MKNWLWITGVMLICLTLGGLEDDVLEIGEPK